VTQQLTQQIPQQVPQLSTVTATTPAVSSVPRMTPVTASQNKRVVINAPPPPVKSEIVTKSIVQAQQPRSRIVTQVPPRQVLNQVQQAASPPIRSRYHSNFFCKLGHKTIDASQGRNQGEKLVATYLCNGGQNLPALVGIGLRYLKI
jgi:hypothetical protein